MEARLTLTTLIPTDLTKTGSPISVLVGSPTQQGIRLDLSNCGGSLVWVSANELQTIIDIHRSLKGR